MKWVDYPYKVTVPWPSTMVSADPNHFYRDWLETNVGDQSDDWDWWVSDNFFELDVFFIREADAFKFSIFGGNIGY